MEEGDIPDIKEGNVWVHTVGDAMVQLITRGIPIGKIVVGKIMSNYYIFC